MASLVGREIDMDYSIIDGRVKYLCLNGEVLVEEDSEREGWKQKLWDWAVDLQMHVDDGMGYRAWVIKLADDLGKELHVRQ